MQNSLDASDRVHKCVNVDISVGEFKAKSLNKHFDKIEDLLNKRFSSKNLHNYIAVRDSNTLGLTGPVRYNDVKNNEFGNLLKLVYEICKPQQNEGAGGSWGLGKTIYFRVGIGLVIYYSRIKQNGKYISRLAACLVEDETKKDSIIPSKGGVKRGIAWWGASDGKNKTVPLENTHDIEKILSVFGINPFSGTETGTIVIIPYVDSAKLLQEVYAINEDKDHKPFWTSTIEDYITVALQRWYAPRFLNTKYIYGAYLKPSVNGKPLKVSSMLPLFRVIRELYILTDEDEVENSFIKESGAEPYIESINVREVFIPGTSCSGYLSYVKMSAAQLLMGAPENNKSPYQQILNCIVPMEDDKNVPIITFTRRPGMLVGYDFDGPWTHRMPRTKSNEYVIGIFVANSENKIKGILDAKNNTEITFEEYIRQGEKADHASWTDRNISGTNPRVISKIQNGVIKKISSQFKEKDIDVTEKKNIGLGHALANILLPSSDFGRRAITPTPPDPGSNQLPRVKKSKFSVISNTEFSKNSIKLQFEIILKRNAILNLQVVTEFTKFSADKWEDEKEIGKRFPLEFVALEINKIKDSKSKQYKDIPAVQITSIDTAKTHTSFSMQLQASEKYHTYSSVYFEAYEPIALMGTVTFRTADTKVKGSFELKEDNK